MARLTGRELRARSEWDCEIEPGMSVRMRKIDMTSAYMLGILPAPLMAALGRLVAIGQRVTKDPSHLADISAQDKAQTLELMQRYACAAIIDPVFVMTDDGNENHCPVTMLTSDQLVLIWKAGPPKFQAEVRPDQAETFRKGAQPVAAPVSNEPKVSRAPVVVPDAVIAEVRVH